MTTSDLIPPPLPDKPPPRRPTNSKTAAEEMKEWRRKSGEYSQEIQDKEEQRLNKHIAASFKRLSLGNELGAYSEFSTDNSAKAGSEMARRSLDWEVENSLFGSKLQQYSSDIYPVFQVGNKFSTPKNSFLEVRNKFESSEPDNGESPPKGFSHFVEVDGSMGNQQKPGAFSSYGYNASSNQPFKESYMDNDKFAVVEMDRVNSQDNSSKDILEDIDEDVVNIKHRISSLKNLLETETQRMSPVGTSQMNKDQQNLNESLDSLESYSNREPESENPVQNEGWATHGMESGFMGNTQIYTSDNTGRSYDSTFPESNTNHIEHDAEYGRTEGDRNYNNEIYKGQPEFIYQPTKPNSSDVQNQYSFDDKSNPYGVSHMRQTSAPTITLQLPQHHRQASFGSQSQGSLLGPKMHQKQGSYDRQASFGSYSKGSSSEHGVAHQRQRSYDRQASFGSQSRSSGGRPPAWDARKRNSLSSDARQGSRQSSYSNFKSSQDFKTSNHWQQPSLDQDYNVGSLNRDGNTKSWKSPRSSTLPTARELHKSQPASTLLEWKLSGSPFKAGTTQDDSVLETSLSKKNKSNLIHLQNRPMSYAEGLKPPLTKLEKLELENQISKSMGAINTVEDLDRETNFIVDNEDRGYQREWEVINNVLKQGEQYVHNDPKLLGKQRAIHNVLKQGV